MLLWVIVGSSQLLLVIACEDFVEVDPPRTEAVTESVFSDEGATSSALAGLYSLMAETALGNGIFGSGLELFTGTYSDELINYSPSTARLELGSNNLTSENEILLNQFWQFAYNIIHNANLIIEGVESSDSLDPEFKKTVIGEALFIRGFSHFYLVNLFGDIPYISTSDFEVNAIAGRDSESIVYERIIADLSQAKEALPVDFEFTQGDRVRITKGAATALLARVYLYTGEWELAQEESTGLIEQSDSFVLENDLLSVFVVQSREAIWQLKPVLENPRATRQGQNFILFSQPGFGGVSIRNDVYNAYEAGDNRRSQWVGIFNNGSDDFYYPHKYKVGITSLPSEEEWDVVLRLGEQYLIRAEARAQLNNISGAQSDLNVIRNRAGLGNTIAGDRQSILEAIYRERRFELFAEWGHRWLDLKRTGLSDEVLSILPDKDWQSTDVLWPIPEQELLNNPNLLPQNPGY